MPKVVVELDGQDVGLSDVLKKGENDVDNFGESLASFGAAGKNIASGGAALLGGAVAGVGIAAFTSANSIDEATKRIQAALGLTGAQAEQLGQIGADVFRAGFTESIGEATAAVGITATQLKNITFDELESATTNALRLSDAFGTDINESLNAANVLMTQFGLSQEESFDFMAAGFQKGLNTSGDFLDSVREYGNLFGQADASAGQFFSLLETGLQGGVLGTDKAADLFKEFSIRIQEGTDAQTAALDTLGINSGALFAGFGDGSISVVEAFAQVQAALNQVSDPMARQALGVELMGTQFEDMGANAATAIDLATTSLADLEGSTATLDTQYDTLGVKFETLGRQAMLAFTPVQLMAETVIPAISRALETAGVGFAALEESGAFSRIAESITKIGVALGYIPENAASATAGMGELETLLGAMETGVMAAVVAIESVATALETAAGLADQLNTIVGLLQTSLGNITAGGLDSITSAFERIKNAIPAWLMPGSPPPLYYALQDINKAASFAPDLSASYGFNNMPSLEGISQAAGNAEGAAMPVSQTINLLLDGQIIASYVSGTQGEARHQRAAMGGAAAL